MKEEIRVIYGKDIKNMTKEILSSYEIEKRIPSTEARIGLKPNLVIAARPETGATTHMEIIAAVIEYLRDRGFRNIEILEGSWVGDDTQRAFRLNGYYGFRDKYGVGLYDTKKDSYRKIESHGMTMEISSRALELDYMINLPVLKGHCQTGMTCAMKNLKGILSDRSKRLFHCLGLMKPIAALNCVYRPSVTLVDSICGDLDFEEGGNPVYSNRLILGEDSVLIDTYCASLLGFRKEDVAYIPLGEEYGAGSADLSKARIITLTPPESSDTAMPELYARRLKAYTSPQSACSCCYAALIHALKRLEEEGKLTGSRDRKIAIGQGWKGKKMEIGVGKCASGAVHGVVRCPPTAEEIMKMLEEIHY